MVLKLARLRLRQDLSVDEKSTLDVMKFAWRKWRGISGAVSTPRLQPGRSAAVSALHRGDVLQQGAPLREVVDRLELEAAYLEGEGWLGLG